MNTRLPQIGAVVPSPPGPRPSRCPEQLRDAAGELSPFSEGESEAPQKGQELFQRASQILMTAFFPQDGAAPPTQAQVLWAVRVFIQLVLMYFGLRTNLPLLAHSTNAATDLLPAIDCSLRFSDVITREDPRVKKAVDFAVVAEQRGVLVALRELWRLGVVFCKCVDAGTTHVEQYLDGTARFVYKKLNDVLGEDYLLQSDLEPLVTLVAAPIAAGIEAKKSNAKLTTEAEQRGEDRVLEQLSQAAPAGGAPGPVPAALTGTGAAARPAVTVTGGAPPAAPGRSKRRA